MASIDPEKGEDANPAHSPLSNPIAKTISFGSLPSKTTTKRSSHSSTAASTSNSPPPITKSASIPHPIDPSLPTPTLGSRTKQQFPASPYPFPQPPRGYPLLATSMAVSPSLSIFRRFSNLNYLALLSLQAELLELEHQYMTQVQADDMSADPVRSGLSTNWHNRHTVEPNNAAQREVLKQICSRLHEYNQLLSSVSATQGLAAPTDGDLWNLKCWLSEISHGANGKLFDFNSVDNPSANIGPDPTMPDVNLAATLSTGSTLCPWDPRFHGDLITLKPASPSSSRLSRILSPALTRLWYTTLEPRLFPSLHKSTPGSHSYSIERDIVQRRDSIMAVVSTIGGVSATLLACLFPVITVIVLLFVEGTLQRLGVTMGFAVAFGGVLVGVTNAELKEVFAAVVSLVGVGVVFIGTSVPG